MRVSEAKLRHSDVQFDMPARMRVLRAAPPAVLLLFLLFPSAAEACGCGGRASSAVSVKAAAAVFTGTVESVSGGMPVPRVAVFRVNRMYRGAPADRMTVVGSGTNCDIDFRPGVAYVVYTQLLKDRVHTTHKCTRTRPVDAGAEDVRFLDSLVSGTPHAVLYGDVVRRTRDGHGKPVLQAPFEKLTVVARSSGKRWSVLTDDWGPYQLVLAPGSYNVWAERKGRRVSAISRIDLRQDEDRQFLLTTDFPCESCDALFTRSR